MADSIEHDGKARKALKCYSSIIYFEVRRRTGTLGHFCLQCARSMTCFIYPYYAYPKAVFAMAASSCCSGVSTFAVFVPCYYMYSSKQNKLTSYCRCEETKTSTTTTTASDNIPPPLRIGVRTRNRRLAGTIILGRLSSKFSKVYCCFAPCTPIFP